MGRPGRRDLDTQWRRRRTHLGREGGREGGVDKWVIVSTRRRGTAEKTRVGHRVEAEADASIEREGGREGRREGGNGVRVGAGGWESEVWVRSGGGGGI